MNPIKRFTRELQHRFFDAVVTRRLVYNTCWEDPRIDRKLLDLDEESSVVMLTSAGCNALDYLLDNPARIHAVDANPHQNALLALKKAIIQSGDYELLHAFFMHGAHNAPGLPYRNKIRPLLSDNDRHFWDERITYFDRHSSSSSFYFHGTSGNVALMTHRYLKRKGLYHTMQHLVNSTSLEEQRYYFEEIDAQLWNRFNRWLVQRKATMALLGVPEAQRRLIERDHDGGLPAFIRTSLRQVFTQLPIRDNYFWRVYITGSYADHCCPNYLKPEHFETLRNRIERIGQHTTSLSAFLESQDSVHSHYVLLDHQDWMARVDPEALEHEWRLILKYAQPGTKILFRSASKQVHFIPDFVSSNVTFHPEITDRLHQQDRVGTYASTHLATVN